MELIDVTEENIEREHICCAIADSGQAGLGVRAKICMMAACGCPGNIKGRAIPICCLMPVSAMPARKGKKGWSSCLQRKSCHFFPIRNI